MSITCVTDDCDKPVKARRRCGTHYDHLRVAEGAVCTYEKCDKPASGRMCQAHAWRKRHGKPMDDPIQTRRSPEEIMERSEDGLKQCTQCQRYLAEDSFPPMPRLPDGLNYACRECLRENSRLRVYGMTPESLSGMLEAQNHCCAICLDYLVKFHVDHDHRCCSGGSSCGDCVRGLLCPKCNRGLGQFNDDPAKITAAAAYISTHLVKKDVEAHA